LSSKCTRWHIKCKKISRDNRPDTRPLRALINESQLKKGREKEEGNGMHRISQYYGIHNFTSLSFVYIILVSRTGRVQRCSFICVVFVLFVDLFVN